MNIRVKFSKHGSMKFIGHLDIMRFFQKAIIRAGIDIAYSEGFNPHQIMSFAAPLSVGVVSDGEYMDIRVKTTKPSAESVKALNECMVEGIRVEDYKLLPDNAKNSMSIVASAGYAIYNKTSDVGFINDVESLNKMIFEYLKQDEILITKATKKGEATLDLKPFIYEFKADSMSFPDEDMMNIPCLIFNISTGSLTNIKPELLMKSFFDYCKEEFNENLYQIYRLEVYSRDESDNLISLNDLGANIEY
ncbi:MAG: TIGR03936 family radical SAM-associated protein [Lachnospiraceae bacterium]|nr:TIGR03936 family radical SAM-associated protein [Lachnospiraceae bacterium]